MMGRNIIRILGFLLISALLAGLQASCRSGQQVQGQAHQPTDDPVVYRGVIDNTCAVEMQYGSYAYGIDSEAYRKALALIGRFGVTYTEKNIGREGETRICLPLTELKKSEKKAFIDSLKAIARGGQLVSVSIR